MSKAVNYYTMKISNTEMHEIFNKIDLGIAFFENKNVPPEEIKILLPGHIITVMRAYPFSGPAARIDDCHRLFPTGRSFSNEKYKGIIDVSPHFKNEVVIYVTNFYFYEKFADPVTFELPDFTEENRKMN